MEKGSLSYHGNVNGSCTLTTWAPSTVTKDSRRCRSTTGGGEEHGGSTSNASLPLGLGSPSHGSDT
ncbi:hypothetical protein DY000_02043091 [Brassica cretica]|uniref:Uncharacterized protein n=1 Tax=Brassica cretica TaxID=69181 RepID=A0ABQ7B597_BRACR|nr:hypothetical protein DY000_02043091 [Brassica cretica]